MLRHKFGIEPSPHRPGFLVKGVSLIHSLGINKGTWNEPGEPEAYFNLCDNRNWQTLAAQFDEGRIAIGKYSETHPYALWLQDPTRLNDAMVILRWPKNIRKEIMRVSQALSQEGIPATHRVTVVRIIPNSIITRKVNHLIPL